MDVQIVLPIVLGISVVALVVAAVLAREVLSAPTGNADMQRISDAIRQGAEVFCPIGITVVVAVLVSLFVSFTLDPMLSSVWLDPPSARMRTLWGIGHAIRATDRGLDALHALYERLIHWAFSARRWRLPLPAYGRPFDAAHRRDRTQPRRWRRATLTPRGVVMAAGGASFFAALALAPLVGSEFIPQTDQGFTQLSIRMATGSSLERSDAKVRQIEEVLARFPEVKNVATNVGGTGNGLSVGRNQASINIGLVDRRERSRTQKQVEDAIRAAIAGIPGIDVSVGFDRPIYVAILGTDAEGLARLAREFAEKVKAIPGIADVELSIKPGAAQAAARPPWFLHAGPHGEFELVFTVPPDRRPALDAAADTIGWHPVRLGTVTAEPGLAVAGTTGERTLDTTAIRNLFAECGGDVGRYMAALGKVLPGT